MSSTFIYTLLQTNITWDKACHLSEKVNYSTLEQCASVCNTALFASSTLLASKPLSRSSICVITISTGLLTYFTEQGHCIEKFVQVIQITATVHSLFWGNNTQRAAIVCVALIVITKRLGYIPTKLVNLYNRYSYLTYALNDALQTRNRSLQALFFAGSIAFSEFMIYIQNYDLFPETGPTTAIDWGNFYTNSSEEQRESVTKILSQIPFDLPPLYAALGIEKRTDSVSYTLEQKLIIFYIRGVILRPSFFNEPEDKNLFFQESRS